MNEIKCVEEHGKSGKMRLSLSYWINRVWWNNIFGSNSNWLVERSYGVNFANSPRDICLWLLHYKLCAMVFR